jgi:hypothetical protein
MSIFVRTLYVLHCSLQRATNTQYAWLCALQRVARASNAPSSSQLNFVSTSSLASQAPRHRAIVPGHRFTPPASKLSLRICS